MDSFGATGIQAALAGVQGGAGGGSGQHAYPYNQDRLLRKESSLGAVREIGQPEDHIGLKYFPFFDVPHDDFVFDYIKGDATGLAPARAQDAESELAQKDFFITGQGRGSIMDWAIKDHYDPGEINNFRELEVIAKQIQEGGGTVPNVVQGPLNEFPFKLARDQRIRRQRLDNRIEHLIWTSVVTNNYIYNDGKVSFQSPWGRPTDQTDQAPKSGTWAGVDHNPIDDFLNVIETMYERYGVNMGRIILGRKIANKMVNSKYWNARSGLITQDGSTPVDLRYVMDQWGPQSAFQAVLAQTGLTADVQDNTYRTRAINSTVFQVNRYIPEDVIIFLPNENEISQFDSNPIGLGKVATSPHVEGNWTSGYYEWEMSTKDPWSFTKGTGIKAFPVFPHMELTYTMKVPLV